MVSHFSNKLKHFGNTEAYWPIGIGEVGTWETRGRGICKEKWQEFNSW